MSTPDPLSPPPSSEQYLPQNTVGEQSFKPALTQSQWHAPSFSEELLQKRQDERQEELKKLAERPFPYHGNETEGCLFKTATIAAFSVPLGFFIQTLMYNYSTPRKTVEQLNMTTRQLVGAEFKKFGKQGWRTGKNFAAVGAMWTAAECSLEHYRGKTDLWNATYGGCATGIMLAARTGSPAAMASSCAGATALALGAEYMMGGATHRPTNLFSSGLED